MNTYDVIIIGDGIAGWGAAYALAKKRKRVLLVSKKGVQGAATSHASGILDPFLDVSSKNPLLKLKQKAFESYPRWISKLAQGHLKQLEYQRCGMFCLAFSKREERELRKKFEWQRKARFPMRWMSREQILKKSPGISSKVKAGIFYPSVAKLNPHKLLKLIKAKSRKLGVVLERSAQSARVRIKDGCVVGIQIGSKRYCAASIIHATGSWAQKGAGLPSALPLKAARGQIAVTQLRGGPVIYPAILSSMKGFYAVPWGSSRYLLGSTVEVGEKKPSVTRKGLGKIQRGIEEILPHLKNKKPQNQWAGLRPLTQDGHPVIGSTAIKGLYLANGYFRSGILIGGYAGDLLAKMLVSGKMPRGLKPFDPRRFRKGLLR